MAIDTKAIQDYLWKALKLTLEACYNIIQAYPKTSVVSITVLFLYAFLPRLLLFLICSSVASAIAIVVYRVYFREDLEGFDNVRGYKKTDDKPSVISENDMSKNVIVLGQSETSRRRNVNERDKQGYAHRSTKDRDVVHPGLKNDDLFDKTAVVEENLKEIREVKVNSGKKKAGPSLQHQGSQLVASPPFSSGVPEEGTHPPGVKAEDGDSSDDTEEEDGREERNKAVEWSVDDQMNLSHVGNIEMERNTRLENLIARRRARKLLDIHVRNTLMRPATDDSRDHIPSILTARKNHFLSSSSEFSPIPGSAPSVLLPMHKSPFDISFDPETEKPISTGDSFKKQILADQQKEVTFSRHESFGRATFSPKKSLQDQTIQDFSFHHGPPEKIEASKTGHQSESSQGNEEDGSEVETKQIVHEKIHERSRSSSSEENIPLTGANKDQLLKSLSSLAHKDVDSDRDDNDLEIHVPYNTDRLLYEKTAGNSFFGEKRMCHAPSNSLASDLQVEVSEVGSPQSTSSNDKSNIFDDYINKEVTSGGEDMSADSSHLSRLGVNESNTREVNEVSKKDITDAGFSGANHNLDPNTSDLQPEKVIQQEESSSHSQPSNIPDSTQVQTTDVKPDHPTSSDATDAPTKNESEDSTKEVVAHTSTSENLKEASPEEVNVVHESVVHNSDGNEGLKSREFMEPEAVAEFPTPVAGIISESLEDTSNKHSDLNISKTSDQKNSPVPVSDEKDPSPSQNTLTQDREEGNVSSHNDKPVTIEDEAHTKSESVKDSEREATLSVKHVDLVDPSDTSNSKASQETKEIDRKIVGNDNVVDTSKSTEEIKNIDSDVKNKELQEAEPHKDINQHLAADGNDNTESIKVVESESSTSTPNEAVVDSKQFEAIDDLGKTTGHTEVKEQSDPHQGKSTVEGSSVSNDKETVKSAAKEKEIKPAKEATKKGKSWKFF